MDKEGILENENEKIYPCEKRKKKRV